MICHKIILTNFKKLYIFPPNHQDRASLCSPGCPRTHSVDQAGLELRNQPASASAAGIKGVGHHHWAEERFL